MVSKKTNIGARSESLDAVFGGKAANSQRFIKNARQLANQQLKDLGGQRGAFVSKSEIESLPNIDMKISARDQVILHLRKQETLKRQQAQLYTDFKGKILERYGNDVRVTPDLLANTWLKVNNLTRKLNSRPKSDVFTKTWPFKVNGIWIAINADKASVRVMDNQER